MSRNKPIIFISHIHEDSAIAKILKNWITNIFLGAVEVFVDSDGASIRGGENGWKKLKMLCVALS